MRQEELYLEIMALAEQSYDQLDGKWQDWLEVARRFEHKVEAQAKAEQAPTEPSGEAEPTEPVTEPAESQPKAKRSRAKKPVTA